MSGTIMIRITVVAATDGRTAYAGIYTVDLKAAVTLMPGCYFSVVVSEDKYALDYEQGVGYADGDDLIWTCPAVSHQDSFCSSNGTDYRAWSMGNFCMKALTVNEGGNTPEVPDVPVNPENSLDTLAAEHEDDVADGIYFVQSTVNQKYVLDVRWASGDNQANAQSYEKNDSNAQRCRIFHDEKGYLTLTNVGSGNVLDVSGAGTANETNIQLYDANGTGAQH